MFIYQHLRVHYLDDFLIVACSYTSIYGLQVVVGNLEVLVGFLHYSDEEGKELSRQMFIVIMSLIAFFVLLVLVLWIVATWYCNKIRNLKGDTGSNSSGAEQLYNPADNSGKLSDFVFYII